MWKNWALHAPVDCTPDAPSPVDTVPQLLGQLGSAIALLFISCPPRPRRAGQEPFNFHLNALFQPSALADPLVIEIQIWITPIMALNDVSHSQYEVARAKSIGAI